MANADSLSRGFLVLRLAAKMMRSACKIKQLNEENGRVEISFDVLTQEAGVFKRLLFVASFDGQEYRVRCHNADRAGELQRSFRSRHDFMAHIDSFGSLDQYVVASVRAHFGMLGFQEKPSTHDDAVGHLEYAPGARGYQEARTRFHETAAALAVARGKPHKRPKT